MQKRLHGMYMLPDKAGRWYMGAYRLHEREEKNMVTFFVPGKPQGKGRPRFGKYAVYTPKATTDYEKLVATCYRGDMLSGPLTCEITAVFEIPKSYTKAQKKDIESGVLQPTKKPDADNIAKIVMDALNGVAYEDDKQVVSLEIYKVYAGPEEQQGMWIKIGEADG